jgi:hypothetical protein
MSSECPEIMPLGARATERTFQRSRRTSMCSTPGLRTELAPAAVRLPVPSRMKLLADRERALIGQACTPPRRALGHQVVEPQAEPLFSGGGGTEAFDRSRFARHKPL